MRDIFTRRDDSLRSYGRSVRTLAGHFIATAAIFLTLILLTWSVEVVFSGLHKLHAFPEDILQIVRNAEIGVVYLDIVVCFAAIVGGLVRFCYDLVRGGSE